MLKSLFFYSITLFSFLFCISLPLCIHLICWTHIHIFQCSISVWNGKKDCENAMWRITFTEYENNRTKKINFLSKKENGNIEKRINRVVGLKYAYIYYSCCYHCDTGLWAKWKKIAELKWKKCWKKMQWKQHNIKKENEILYEILLAKWKMNIETRDIPNVMLDDAHLNCASIPFRVMKSFGKTMFA